MRTVKEISDLTGISVRTLHYYDEIGLLKPTEKSDAGYRLYDDKALETLQQILFFREFDISLKEIKAVLDNPALERNQILQVQRKMLVTKKERMERLIASIDDILKGENKMDFTIFTKTEVEEMFQTMLEHMCCLIFTVPAYAQSSEPQPETASAPAETEAEPETQNPFTPDGTGTVVDNATDEDGKEFYTITTADESVFYLVIDKQKTSENVYFLNTVTTDDLLPLAEQGKEPPKEVTPEPEPKPTEPVEEVPEPEPEKKDSPLLSLLLIGAVVLAGGGIGYYFKIYKPKHEAPDLEDDYCEYEDGELEEIAEEPEDEDTPPWEEDTEE